MLHVCVMYLYALYFLPHLVFSFSHAPSHPHILTFNHHPHTHHLHTHTFTPSHSHPHLHTLTQILVECGTTGGKWLFPCHRWLCLDAGDGRIERELHPTVEEKEGRRGERRWRVHVWTSDIRGAGTDANVTLQVSQLGILTLLLRTSPLKGYSGYSLMLYRLKQFTNSLISPRSSLEPEAAWKEARSVHCSYVSLIQWCPLRGQCSVML